MFVLLLFLLHFPQRSQFLLKARSLEMVFGLRVVFMRQVYDMFTGVSQVQEAVMEMTISGKVLYTLC